MKYRGFSLLHLFLTLSLAIAGAQEPAARGGKKNVPDSAPGPWMEARSEPAGMKYRTLRSTIVGTDVSFLVYLPPGYESDAPRRYPVVYWLHGRGGSQTGAATFASRLDNAIQAGKAPPMIVVGLNGLKFSSWVDSFNGRYPVQSVIVKEILPHVDAHYRTLANRANRAVEGFSMGGAGAAKIGFRHVELFGVVSVLGGALHDLESYMGRGNAFADIYGSNQEYFQANSPWVLAEKNADRIRGRTYIRIAVGANDGLKERNAEYHELLTRLTIAHTFDVVPDAAHNPGQVFDGLGDRTWEFYRRAFAPAAH